MTRTEYLLVVLAEECAEVAHAASKAIRFGLTDVNVRKIVEEYYDIIAVFELLCYENIPNCSNDFDFVRHVEGKQIRVEQALDVFNSTREPRED